MNPENFHTNRNGKDIRFFRLQNQNGLRAEFCNYGARWLSFIVPGRDGQWDDIVLGFNTIQEYIQAEERYHGAIVGRVAGRIKGASFFLHGRELQLSANEQVDANRCNHLHGGQQGLSFQVWEAESILSEEGEAAVQFRYESADGEEGYPGNFRVAVTYTLTNDNAVKITYEATTDRPTPVSLTNHAYFNLKGQQGETVLDHELQIAARQCLEFDPSDFCVTGKSLPVENTPLDFQELKKIGADINSSYYQLPESRGYNSYFVLDTEGQEHRPAAVLQCRPSGRQLSIFTTEPGLQLYSAGYWSGVDCGKDGKCYPSFGGVALEAHGYPDSVHHAHFPPLLLQPNETYHQVTIYKFSIL